MYDVIDIAKYIIEYSIKINKPVSNLKLQKLLYYVQAAFLVEFDKKCFEAPILAWEYGPVVKEVYDEFKIYGRDNIPKQENTKNMNFDFSKIQIVCQRGKAEFSPKECEIANKVVDSYANIQNPFELVEKTHSEDPWITTKRGREITTDLIKSYYSLYKEKIYNN